MVDSSLCNLFQIEGHELKNPAYARETAKSKRPVYKFQLSNGLNERDYNQVSPNWSRQIEELGSETETRVCKMYVQNLTGGFTDINSWRSLTNAGIGNQEFFSTQDALQRMEHGRNIARHFYCGLSWWDKGHVPKTNQLLFRTKTPARQGLSISSFSKIMQLNVHEKSAFQSLLCAAKNANGVQEFQGRDNFSKSFLEADKKLLIQRHFQRVLSLQFLFIHMFKDNDATTHLYHFWPCLPSVVRHGIVVSCWDNCVASLVVYRTAHTTIMFVILFQQRRPIVPNFECQPILQCPDFAFG